MPGFLSVKEAALWASVSTKTIQRWIERGLPIYQAGPREKVLIKPSDIERYLTRKQQAQLDLNAVVDGVLAEMALPTRTRRAA
ncbi:helix-turn-helix domain-containing protein [Nitrospira sp. Nam80]